jgi:hypothetical protein
MSKLDEDIAMYALLKAGLAAPMILLISLFLPLDAISRDFDKPVEYAPLYISDIEPERVSSEQLEKGLEVTYYLEFFERSLEEIPKGDSSSYIVKKGDPISEINHQFGAEEVFSSGTNRGVALRMTGYLNLREKGEYQLQALSNDGVVVMIDDALVISDPEQHADRLSNIGFVTIDQPGHYAVVIEYFQRKGTAALKLFWKTPGADDFVPIPADAYAHLP